MAIGGFSLNPVILPDTESQTKILFGLYYFGDDSGGEVPCLVIDGKTFSWHEFGRMLMTFKGSHFKLKIFESSQEK